ncbi:cytochrome c oxidase accessory protein CcoG [Hahella sp. CCB-MM4]|uniref:cytochrome c oxidase accessory protein CcoG n=1 Tax=Hahella sp. (strain CCB-MM4) TaxID=1926491 RepID=UPI000B9C53EF|nr:cytochrome c oxidase accessory protein CcoG [Hahella sp. CCB-MM4]OZG70355.1 cytochrome c oxidase accessory protein CcoG [Hahella sp. CCB-MM4]
MSELIPVHNLPSESMRFFTPAKIHTRSFTGYFRRLRILGVLSLFILFFGTAWMDWNGRQAVLWDLSKSKFHIFGSTFWPQDFILLSAILIICAFGLFFITVLAGRVWCGYSCPQSVWTWIFMWVEKVTEGDRNQRVRLDKAAFSANKLLRRAAKHGLWLLISLVTALAFVGYFTPIRELVTDLATFKLQGWPLFWTFFFTIATYLNAGWLREKVCFHMCPYGRFQSTMLDADSLVVSYDSARGENRGPRKKGVSPSQVNLGDCIDCYMCVQVCPTGIDIRDGLQMECIGCAACIDACDSIMDKMGYEQGLIRYTSERELSEGKRQIIRPRLVSFAVVLLTMIALFLWALSARSLVTLDVEKDRSLYQFNADNEIENTYILKILNKSQIPHTFAVTASGLEGLGITGSNIVEVDAGSMVEVFVSLAVPPENIHERSYKIQLNLTATDDSNIQANSASIFTGPVF